MIENEKVLFGRGLGGEVGLVTSMQQTVSLLISVSAHRISASLVDFAFGAEIVDVNVRLRGRSRWRWRFRGKFRERSVKDAAVKR